MYIWIDAGGWFSDAEELYEDSHCNCNLLGEFSKDDPETFWKYVKKEYDWYPEGNLAEYVGMTFNIEHPVHVCVIIRSRQSGRIMVRESMIKRGTRQKWEAVHILPSEFCYKQSAALDVYETYMDYMVSDKQSYSDLKFLKEFDTEDMKYLVYITECEYDEREDKTDNHGYAWLLPSEIIPAPDQEEIVKYLMEVFQE